MRGGSSRLSLRGKVAGLDEFGVDEQREEQMSMQPSRSERLAFGGQSIDVQQRLHALESEFDLPAHTIQRRQAIRWERRRRART